MHSLFPKLIVHANWKKCQIPPSTDKGKCHCFIKSTKCTRPHNPACRSLNRDIALGAKYSDHNFSALPLHHTCCRFHCMVIVGISSMLSVQNPGSDNTSSRTVAFSCNYVMMQLIFRKVQNIESQHSLVTKKSSVLDTQIKYVLVWTWHAGMPYHLSKTPNVHIRLCSFAYKAKSTL